MKRTFGSLITVLAATVLFAGLVYAVLIAANVSEPAVTTVNGLTLRRLWATTAVLSALTGLIIGGLALSDALNRFRKTSRRFGAIVALAAGLFASLNGGLNVAVANGGPGSGNGVVGGAAAFVLGLSAVAVGSVALARCRRSADERTIPI